MRSLKFIFKKVESKISLRWSVSGAIAIGVFLNITTPLLAETLRVGTKPFAPFSFEQEGQYTGFSIELWEEIAQELELEYEFRPQTTVTDLLDSVSSGDTDIAIAYLELFLPSIILI